jgi:hypothetical protein
VLGFGRGCFSTELSRSLGRVRCSSVARSDPMTVGANDLALRDFRFDRIERGFVPTQLANSVELRLAWQVIEIERGWVGIVPTVSASTLQLDRVDDVHDTQHCAPACGVAQAAIQAAIPVLHGVYANTIRVAARA